MSSNQSFDVTTNKAMEKGIDQILGKIPYRSVERPASCVHESDGLNYAHKDITTFITTRCIKCGEYYDEPIK